MFICYFVPTGIKGLIQETDYILTQKKELFKELSIKKSYISAFKSLLQNEK